MECLTIHENGDTAHVHPVQIGDTTQIQGASVRWKAGTPSPSSLSKTPTRLSLRNQEDPTRSGSQMLQIVTRLSFSLFGFCASYGSSSSSETFVAPCEASATPKEVSVTSQEKSRPHSTRLVATRASLIHSVPYYVAEMLC